MGCPCLCGTDFSGHCPGCSLEAAVVVLAVAVQVRHVPGYSPHGQRGWSLSEAVVKGH